MVSIWELYVYGQYMGSICIWPVYGSYMASTVNSYNPHIWDLEGTCKSLPYIPYKPHIDETVTVVPAGKYLLFDTMHVHNRTPLQLKNLIFNKVYPDFIHLAVKCKTYNKD